MKPARRLSALKVAKSVGLAVVLLALLALSAPHYPEDWDGIGFVFSIAHFDLARFTPHPPGYPVYVAALKFAAFFEQNMTAATAVSVASGAAAILLLRDAAARTWGTRAGWLVAEGVLLTPLFWRSATVIGTEGLALMFVALAAWGLSRHASAVVGVAVGLGLGVRLSWAPFFVPLLFLVARPGRARAAVLAVLAVLAWLVPLLAVVGLVPLVTLLQAHFGGHAARWGGTFLTEPGAERALWMLRDVFVDGLGIDGDAIGVGLAVAFVVVAVRALSTWKQASFIQWRAVAILVVPYFAWIAVGQNLREQPRHVLPLVVVLGCAVGLAASRDRVALYACAVFFSLMGTRAVLDAYARKTIPPAGAQLALYVNAHEDERTMVFGARSIRFFDVIPGSARAQGAATLGDVTLSLDRQSVLPRRALVTSELEGLANARYPVTPLEKFCRPARLDRREPCLTLFDLKAPFLGK